MRYRSATPDDVAAIAGLHADSWRRSYRGIYADSYLDGEIGEERPGIDRAFAARGPNEYTTVAERDGEIVGFVHTIVDDDPRWGALLDHLHVRFDMKRSGIGTRLMSQSAEVVLDVTPLSGLFLWVLEANKAGQAFYEARGGRCVAPRQRRRRAVDWSWASAMRGPILQTFSWPTEPS